jgi:hypothetical protein
MREGDIAADKVTGGLAPGGAFPPPPPRDFGRGGGVTLRPTLRSFALKQSLRIRSFAGVARSG